MKLFVPLYRIYHVLTLCCSEHDSFDEARESKDGGEYAYTNGAVRTDPVTGEIKHYLASCCFHNINNSLLDTLDFIIISGLELREHVLRHNASHCKRVDLQRRVFTFSIQTTLRNERCLTRGV